MNDRASTITTILLGTTAITAEVNLMRMFVRDWRRGRREERANARRPNRHSERHGRCTLRPATSGLLPAFAVPGLLLAAGPLPRAQAEEPNLSLPAQSDASALTLRAPACFLQPPGPAAAAVQDAQPLTISTNRPTFTDTAGTVPLGHFQLETGYTFAFDSRGSIERQTHNGPELLGRIALIEDRLELQLGTSGYVWSRMDSGAPGGGFDASDGFSDVVAAVRVKVLNQSGWAPRIALQAATTVGAGSRGVSNGDVEPTFKFIWSYDLGDGWGLYGNLGIAYPTSGGERFLQGQAGACLTYAINNKWAVFGEYYLFGPNAKGTNAAQYIDGGAAYLMTPRVQFDARVGAGLTRQSNDLFAGAGISFLF